jgi:hypothetical protein
MSDKTQYAEWFEKHYSAGLGMVRYFFTQLADEAIEIAARAVMLAAPMPNAISMFNITQREQGFTGFQAFAFSLTLEIVVFLLVEIALIMWDGFLIKPRAYKWPFIIMTSVVLAATVIVVSIVYSLEPHKVMAWLPVISLCSFVGIGLKRWHERNKKDALVAVQSAVVPEVQPLNDETIERRKRVATHYLTNPTDSLQRVADALNITSKTTVNNDLKWLEKQAIVHVERTGKTTNVQVNGQYEHFVNG